MADAVLCGVCCWLGSHRKGVVIADFAPARTVNGRPRYLNRGDIAATAARIEDTVVVGRAIVLTVCVDDLDADTFLWIALSVQHFNFETHLSSHFH